LIALINAMLIIPLTRLFRAEMRGPLREGGRFMRSMTSS